MRATKTAFPPQQTGLVTSVKLIQLELENFKGIRSFALNLGGANADIYGDNGTGKTSIADAWAWLLFGRDASGRTNFDIKTIGPAGVLNALEHSVSAVLDVGGDSLSLKRTYKEVYEQRTGALRQTFTGHTTDYRIDGVIVPKSDFDACINGLCPVELFRQLIDPAYFTAQMGWKERRSALLELCGDMSDADVIASNSVLAELPVVLGKRTVEAHRSVVIAERKEVNGLLSALPVRIDEASRSIPADLDVPDPDVLLARREALSALIERRASASAAGEVSHLTLTLRELEAQARERETQIRAAGADQREQMLAAGRAADHEIAGVDLELSSARSLLAQTQTELSHTDATLLGLREEYRLTAARTYLGADTCPACGQPLPTDQLQAAIQAFNLDRSNKLESNRAQGQRIKARWTELTAQIAQIQAQLETLTARRSELVYAKSQLPRPEPIDLTGDSEYAKLGIQIENLRMEIESAKSSPSIDQTRLDAEIAAMRSLLAQSESAAHRIELAKTQQERIDALRIELKQLAARFERLERELFMLDEFVRTKVSLLTERINSRFSLVSFRLFRELVNGSLEECCDVLVDGVSFDSTLNFSAKVNAGIECMNVFAQHHGFAPPIFIDSCESITRLLPPVGQNVRLIVSASDTQLRVAAREE